MAGGGSLFMDECELVSTAGMARGGDNMGKEWRGSAQLLPTIYTIGSDNRG